MSKVINAVLVLYAVVMSGMGLEAFLVKGSKPSLAGVAFGILMLVSLGIWTKNPRAGRIMSVVVAFLGMGRPLMNIKSLTPYPGGAILAVSLLTIAFLVYGHLSAMKEKRAA
jgi:uncharacterized membrane protein (UPF0136 family)